MFRALRPTILLALLTACGLAGATGTPAGTEITNQAQALFTPADTGMTTSTLSNVVRSTVQPVCALSVAPDGTAARPAYTATRLPGERAGFAYTLVNAGNAPQTFAVAGRSEAGSTVTPALRVVRDSNGNLLADAGEPQVTSVTLAADASVSLILVADLPQAQGRAEVNLVGACAGGQVDDNNVSVVEVGPPPALTLGKTFSPVVVRPGSETQVTVTLHNGGAGESREVVLTDLLDAQAAAGLTFVPRSAAASAGTVEYTQDGATWSAVEASPVRGVRVRVASVAPGADVQLRFRMLATDAAENAVIPNTATAVSSDVTLSASASADVRYMPAVALGPVGNAQAPELGPDDRQTWALSAVGQSVCFDHTLLNTGDVRDAYTVTVAAPGATVTLFGAAGAPLPQPLLLDPGQSAAVRVCYVPTQAGPQDALVTATGARGPSNATRDVITRVEGQLPQLVKTAVASSTAPDGTPVTIPEGGTVSLDDTIAYTLTVTNPYAYPLSAVVVSDAVPAHLDVTDAGGSTLSGAPGEQRVTWTLAALAAGETRALHFTARVSDRAVDGEALLNTFTLSSAELPVPLRSNEVRTAVWAAKLVITKTVSAPSATFGDLLTYTLTITNTSATAEIRDAVITDRPVVGLEYVAGSSGLNGGALADPEAASGTLRWTVPLLAPGKTVTLTYRMRVTPAASGDLVNVVEVTGTGGGGTARAVASNRATAVTKLNVLNFAPLSDILGTVYVDRNRNGRYDPLIDLPVPRARILLAGGRQAVTDERGRYSFLNVPNGTQALRLDPNTTPYPPLHVPRDGGLSGTQTVYVAGLTGVDFPLAPLGGDIAALRRTTLRMGAVRVEKTVYAVDGGYAVTLIISTPQALDGVNLRDPLPAGATLKEGRQDLVGTLPAGETTLTYTFTWSGDPRAATTDPTLTWSP